MSATEAASGTSYPNAPVRLVVLSVEYPGLAAPSDHVPQLHEALRPLFPLVNHHQETRLSLGITGDLGASQQVWTIPSFSTRDRQSTVAIRPDQLVIETRRYDAFDWFLDLVRGPLDAVRQVLAPDAVTAIGHRFIDEVHLPTGSGGDLSRWFDPALSAMAGMVEPQPDKWQAVISYRPDTESQLTLRYGPLDAPMVPPPGGAPVGFADKVVGLDWDSRWVPAAAPEFKTDSIINQVGSMYAPVRALFRRVCTDDLRELFNTTQIEGEQ